MQVGTRKGMSGRRTAVASRGLAGRGKLGGVLQTAAAAVSAATADATQKAESSAGAAARGATVVVAAAVTEQLESCATAAAWAGSAVAAGPSAVDRFRANPPNKRLKAAATTDAPAAGPQGPQGTNEQVAQGVAPGCGLPAGGACATVAGLSGDCCVDGGAAIGELGPIQAAAKHGAGAGLQAPAVGASLVAGDAEGPAGSPGMTVAVLSNPVPFGDGDTVDQPAAALSPVRQSQRVKDRASKLAFPDSPSPSPSPAKAKVKRRSQRGRQRQPPIMSLPPLMGAPALDQLAAAAADASKHSWQGQQRKKIVRFAASLVQYEGKGEGDMRALGQDKQQPVRAVLVEKGCNVAFGASRQGGKQEGIGGSSSSSSNSNIRRWQRQAAKLDECGGSLLAEVQRRDPLVLGQRHMKARQVVLKHLGRSDPSAPLGALLMELGSRLPTMDLISMVVNTAEKDFGTSLMKPNLLGPHAVLGGNLPVISVWRALLCCGFDLGQGGRGARKRRDCPPAMLDSTLLETLLFSILGNDDDAIIFGTDLYPMLMDVTFSPASQDEDEDRQMMRVMEGYQQGQYTHSKVKAWFTTSSLKRHQAPSLSLFDASTIYIPVNPNGVHWMLTRAANSPSSSNSAGGSSSAGGGSSSSQVGGSRAQGSSSNSSRGHWELAAYDSLSTETTQLNVLDIIKRLLEDEWNDVKGGAPRKAALPEDMLEGLTFSMAVCPVARQEDGSSCGLWVTENAWVLAHGGQPSERTCLLQAQARVLLLVKGLVMLGGEATNGQD